MKKYRFGIVGLGVISKYYIAALKKNSQTELKAVCARSASLRKPFEVKKIVGYENYIDLINDPQINVVIVATPNNTHAEIIKAALLAGKHVICEKPLTITTKDALILINLAKKMNVLLFTVFHRRYNKELSSLFKNFKLRKKINVIYARYLEYIPDHSSVLPWHYDTFKSGGGCVIDNGINVIDTIQKLVGDLKLVDVHLGIRGKGLKSHDANAFLVYKFKGGKAYIELDWYYQGEVKDITLFLSDGSIIRKNMLAHSLEFKGSLWHEYEGVIKDTISKIKSSCFKPDLDSLKALSAVEDVYKGL